MNEWINQVLAAEHASLTVLAAVFLMGMISVLSCGCNLAVIGMVAGYSGVTSTGSRSITVIIRGLAFLAGGVISMALIGALFGFAGQWISNPLGNYWKIAAGLISIFFGLYSMDLLPFRLPGIRIKKEIPERNLLSAVIFGLAIGGLSTAMNSCCNPLFPVILAATFVKGSVMWGLFILTIFSLGYGIPLAAMMTGLSLGLGMASKTLSRISVIVKYAGGIALVALGFYFLFTF